MCVFILNNLNDPVREQLQGGSIHRYMCLHQCMWRPLIILFLRRKTIVPFCEQALCKSALILVPRVFTSTMILFSICCTCLMAEVHLHLKTLGPKVPGYQDRSIDVIFPWALKRKWKYMRSQLSPSPNLYIECFYFSMWSLIVFIRDCEHLKYVKIYWHNCINIKYMYSFMERLPMHTVLEEELVFLLLFFLT